MVTTHLWLGMMSLTRWLWALKAAMAFSRVRGLPARNVANISPVMVLKTRLKGEMTRITVPDQSLVTAKMVSEADVYLKGEHESGCQMNDKGYAQLLKVLSAAHIP